MKYPRVYTTDNTHRQILRDFEGDAIHVRESGITVQHKVAFDTLSDQFGHLAHRDFIQLIPSGRQWCQFALGSLSDVLIADNWCYSEGKLQGIFASDGMFRELQLIKNVIVTESQHKISVGGVISGVAMGNNVDVILMPARIGGRPKGFNNVWVNSFLEDDYDVFSGNVIDRRRDIINEGDIHLNNFDLVGFKIAVADLPLGDEVNDYCASLQQLALQFGEI